jgi:ketosteroid isomerase-like protein
MSESDTQVIKRIYDCFNARDIDGVLAILADDVAWANGMDGGHVHGRQAVRDYWTRQWAIVSPHVEPVAFQKTKDGAVAVEVIQTVHDLNGQPLKEQSHGLKDKTVVHVFHMEGDKITRFDIQDAR